MYGLINRNVRDIMELISPDPNYESLLKTAISERVKTDKEFQSKFRAYWGMNAALLGVEFYRTYFDALSESLTQSRGIEAVIPVLYEASVRKDGRKSLQFSFASKLVHTAQTRQPIYDSHVAEFYFFEMPVDLTFEQRLQKLLAFYHFLVSEYARIIEAGLLSTAINEFRAKNPAECWTDEKIIDSLIWGAVKLLHLQRIQYA